MVVVVNRHSSRARPNGRFCGRSNFPTIGLLFGPQGRAMRSNFWRLFPSVGSVALLLSVAFELWQGQNLAVSVFFGTCPLLWFCGLSAWFVVYLVKFLAVLFVPLLIAADKVGDQLRALFCRYALNVVG